MKISAVLLIALMVSLPLIQAQEAPSEEVIPEDIAEMLTGVGGGPAIAAILDIFDTIGAVIFDIIDTFVAFSVSGIVFMLAVVFDIVAALWAKGLGALASPFVASCTLFLTCCGIIPWDTWLMGCWHCFDYVPCLAFFPHMYSVLKSCLQLCGI